MFKTQENYRNFVGQVDNLENYKAIYCQNTIVTILEKGK